MRGYCIHRLLLVACFAVVLLGCERKQYGPRVARSSETDSASLPSEEVDAKDILNKAVAAHGGERAASCWKCGYLKYKAKAGLVPGQMHEATLEDTFQLPGHFKRITRTREGERESVMVFVANDGKLWTKIGDAP